MSDSGCRTAKVHLIEDKHYKISRLGPAVGDAGIAVVAADTVAVAFDTVTAVAVGDYYDADAVVACAVAAVVPAELAVVCVKAVADDALAVAAAAD